jgi:hypothetical protein
LLLGYIAGFDKKFAYFLFPLHLRLYKPIILLEKSY